ncbi:thiamine transporter ThiT [Marinithermofilum abyssi]|uniref:Thiamine transporter ThiT n=1 Tax=Marinithermofilum abyssi TaxID=1571185 RepID=A0A8J2VFB9_9BACL|nr:energy-coupled thiamine transporter ThiT [Marinithermofilum abyssi]GGE16775.1 thiamine transporter ThiT [Marinithermofilum abyssi]
MNRQRLLTMIEIAIMAGIGVLFSTYITIRGLWPQGGSVSLAMVPIVILSFRRGWVAGVICGLLVGMLNFVLAATPPVHPVQVVLDYPLAFALLGTAGWIRLQPGEKGTFWKVAAGVTLAGLLRFLAHFISGVVWFGSFAPKGMSVWVYSFLYNISYILPDILVSTAVMALLIRNAPQLIRVNQ